MSDFFYELGRGVFVLGVCVGLMLLAGHIGVWRHRWRLRHNPIYREDHERRARYLSGGEE